MKKLKIFISRNNVYNGQVERLTIVSQLQTDVVYIEDFISGQASNMIDKNDIIYFLCCNCLLMPKAIEILVLLQCTIVNKEYLLHGYRKEEIQEVLSNNGITVPATFSASSLDNLTFPLFCKEKKHEGIIFQVYNKRALIRFFEKFDKNDFYLEQAIFTNKTDLKELKVYYIYGKVFINDNVCDSIIKEICTNIAHILNDLEVFSVDIIPTIDGDYYVIDVNCAAGFSLSNRARSYFLDSLI